MRTYTKKPPGDRIKARTIQAEGGCHLWTGAVHKTTGYGCITVDGRAVGVHRVAYTEFVGPIPDGLTVDHICRVRHCVNPDHLRLATPQQQAQNRKPFGKSGVRNVAWIPSRGKWRVVVKHDGRDYFGGEWLQLDAAVASARRLRAQLFTHHVEP